VACISVQDADATTSCMQGTDSAQVYFEPYQPGATYTSSGRRCGIIVPTLPADNCQILGPTQPCRHFNDQDRVTPSLMSVSRITGIPPVARLARIPGIARRRWRRRWRDEVPPRRYPISHVYPIPAPMSPIRSPIPAVSASASVTVSVSVLWPRGPRRNVERRWLCVRDTRAQAEGAEAQSADDRGFGHDFLQIHRAIPRLAP